MSDVIVAIAKRVLQYQCLQHARVQVAVGLRATGQRRVCDRLILDRQPQCAPVAPVEVAELQRAVAGRRCDLLDRAPQ